jgi:nucleotide-binding universal stress UspA family protein
MMPAYKTILTTTDFSDPALLGIRYAADLAAKLKCKLILAYVVEERLPALILAASPDPTAEIIESHRKHAEKTLADYAEEHLAGTGVETVVLQGFAHVAIVELARARKADLIVLGTHGHGFMSHVLMGSTTERVIHEAPCPVMVVPSRR